jgi:TIR domain
MAIDIFISYAQDDQELRIQLGKHLSSLKNQQIIREWYNGYIVPGTPRKAEILKHLAEAQIILLLISVDFVASDFCYSIEMTEAIARHKARQARVVPILLRPVDIQGTPFADLSMLPSGGEPVSKWSNLDDAFIDIVWGIRRVVEDLIPNPPVAYRGKQAPAR